jgi:TusA-related sulfurtransferase/rhodanese-related sulfurtransferase
MQKYIVSHTVDARGLSCPMPIVRARKAIDTLQVGDVLEVLVTDKGAPADFRSWCQQTEHKFLDAEQEQGYTRLLVKKLVPETKEKGRVYPHEMTNDQLLARLQAGEWTTVVDVREADEYAAGHIPGAILVPIETIEDAAVDLDPSAEIAVVCRSGCRSDYACQMLSRKGFGGVWNVVPGMSGWTGPIEK